MKLFFEIALASNALLAVTCAYMRLFKPHAWPALRSVIEAIIFLR